MSEVIEENPGQPIAQFQGEHRFLSNFFPANVHFEGFVYPSVEHAFQAAKTLDPQARLPFLKGTAVQAKRMGRQLVVRADWEQVKVATMHQLVLEKFETNPELQKLLLDTGRRLLVEGNWWNDRFWGVCQGQGKNHLGLILMEVRTHLREKKGW